jgi:hypothetical protein
MKEIL